MSVKTATAEPKGQRNELDEAAPLLKRRVPAWLIGATGAVIGGGFGAGVERMFFGPPLIMVILGGMTLALCGLALWRVIDPLTRPEAVLVREARGRGRARELEREKQAVLKAIKEIELDYQMRKIADADYRELIERYRGRAMRLISEIDAGDNFRELIERELKDRLAGSATSAGVAPAPIAAATAATAATAVTTTEVAPSAEPGPRPCAACGTTNDDDAQFCKKCGVKIAT